MMDNEDFQIGDFCIIEGESPSQFLVLDFRKGNRISRDSYWIVFWLPGSYHQGSGDKLYWGSYAAEKAKVIARL